MTQDADSQNLDYKEISPEEQEELLKKMEEDPVYFIEVFIDRELSQKQRDFINSTKFFKHVVAIWSRQTGKSTVIASYIVWRLLYGKGVVINNEHMNERIAVVAPIKEQHNMIYGKIRTIIEHNEHIFNFIEKMNSEEIIMKNGNQAKFMSASPGAHIRGYTATCIVIDESQDVIDEKYSADIMPFGSTTNALVIEAGTPKTKNHFYNTVVDKSGSIKVVRQPWFECPFISKEYVMQQKAISPDSLWRQEYLCEFIEEGVLVFPSKLFEPEEKAGKLTGRWNLSDYQYITKVDQLTKERMIMVNEQVREGAQFCAGLDLGRQNDQTVYTIYRVDTRPIKLEVMIEFPLDTNYKVIAAALAMFHKVYQPYEFNIDYTNEKSFIEMLQENNVPVVIDKKMIRGAIQFTNKNKAEMVNTTKILLENYQLTLPREAELLISQFLNQQFEIMEGSNKYRFFHPSNEHDDALWSTLLALKNITLLTYEDILTWRNPWEAFDELHHGLDQKNAKEVLVANKNYTKERRMYVGAEERRMSHR